MNSSEEEEEGEEESSHHAIEIECHFEVEGAMKIECHFEELQPQTEETHEEPSAEAHQLQEEYHSQNGPSSQKRPGMAP
ncbi:hypothetical protein Acr_06g0009630 [Actinidia rufa]|uniref:Uncharacterized protein n=1 Tax=Actinidia rufa TaxID=165716 RepID=A0A7J0ERG0_9ERIC|nr:hypothetical protein Acr_06g0009630 [Actinidia rufa]